MRVLVVFNHPYDRSFCAAIREAALEGLRAAGHDCDVVHLDEDAFDPVMRAKDLRAFVMAHENPQAALQLVDPLVADYGRRLEQAEHAVFIFPIWWELMPALMKGFVDKVIFPGIAYEQTDRRGSGMTTRLSKLRGVTVITTMNTPALIYRLLFGNAIGKALLLGTFWKIGVKNRKWISLTNVKSRTQEQRRIWLGEIENRMRLLA